MKIEMARKYIDIAASEARNKYISTGVGQESTYLLKAQQAKEFKALSYTGDIPILIQSEMYATGETAQECTDSILLQESQWVYLASQIEKIRRTGKVALDSITDPLLIEEHCESVIATLHSL